MHAKLNRGCQSIEILLVSTLQPEIRRCSLANLSIARKVRCTYVACAMARSLERCGWHLTTRNWPVIALHHYGMEPKSTCPSRMGVQYGFTGLAALTAAAK